MGNFATKEAIEKVDKINHPQLKTTVLVNISRHGRTVYVEFFYHANGCDIVLFRRGFRRWFGLAEPDFENWLAAHRYKREQAELINEYQRTRELV